ncbi:hypothetical protein SH139x_004577 [Planctomycetaceae bacterium SH139]
MGWLRRLFGVPDDVWADAAGKLGAEFVQGEWLANSEIKLSHRGFPITLGADFDSDSDSGTEYTRAVPSVRLNPHIKLAVIPQVKGLLGSVASGLAARTGATIKIPSLGEDYLVLGEDEELANEVFGHRDFLSALKGLTQNPKILVGRTSSVDFLADEKEDDFYVSVRGVLKDIHQLVALVELTKVLLDLLDENGCLAATES